MNLRCLFDLHRAPGLWLLPVTLTLAVTGLCLTWQEEMRDVVRWVSPVGERLHYDFPDTEPPAAAIGVDAAIAHARRHGAADADSVVLLPRKGVYAIRSHDPRDLDGMGRAWTYVGMADGRLMGRRHDNGESAGDAFFAWQYPLHSGKAFGAIGRWLVFAGGVATVLLTLTGFWLWWRRRPRSAMRSSSVS